MKNAMIGLAVLVMLGCGWLLIQERHDLDEARSLALARDRDAESARTTAATVMDERDALARQLAANRNSAAPRNQSETTGAGVSSNGNPTIPTNRPNAFLRDPLMKEMLQAEARVGAARQVNAVFQAGLGRQLQLSDAQADQLKRLLTQKSLLTWQGLTLPMGDSNQDPAALVTNGAAVKAAFAENEAQIRALLGKDGYEVARWYEKTQGDREDVSRFGTQLAGTGAALTADQQARLLNAMIAERGNFKFTYDFDDPGQIDFSRPNEIFTEEKYNTTFQEMATLNDRVVQRAQAMLTPDQATQLGDFLADRLQKARFVIRSTMALMDQRQ